MNSFTGQKLIVEILVRRIREPAQDASAGAAAEAALAGAGAAEEGQVLLSWWGVKNVSLWERVSAETRAATGADLPALGTDRLWEGPGKPLESSSCVVWSHHLLRPPFLAQTVGSGGERHQVCIKMVVATASTTYLETHVYNVARSQTH